MLSFRLAILEVPVILNGGDDAYACAAMRHAILERASAPFPALLLYGQKGVVRAEDPGESQIARDAALAWRSQADVLMVYVDQGVNDEMIRGVRLAHAEGIPVEAASLHGADADALLAAALNASSDSALLPPAAFRRVMLESPYAAPTPEGVAANEAYARRALRDALLVHQAAPMASHLLYTKPGCLDDRNSEERKIGIDAGLAWRRATEASLVYVDNGVSTGMTYGIRAARASGKCVLPRSLDGKDAPAILDAAMAQADAKAA